GLARAAAGARGWYTRCIRPRHGGRPMIKTGQVTVPHVPVMVAHVLDVLKPRDGGIYVDGTFGAGGYTRAILGAADCAVLAIDRDPSAILRGRARSEERRAGRRRRGFLRVHRRYMLN